MFRGWKQFDPGDEAVVFRPVCHRLGAALPAKGGAVVLPVSSDSSRVSLTKHDLFYSLKESFTGYDPPLYTAQEIQALPTWADADITE